MTVQELLGTLKAAGLSLRSVKLSPTAGDVVEFACDEARDTGTVVPVIPSGGPVDDDEKPEALETFLNLKERNAKGDPNE